MGNAGAPWAPSDNEDEYGAPLTMNEVQAVENLLGNVSAHDAEDAPERREQTPAIMCSQLKEYQKIGLTWLIKVLECLKTSRGRKLTLTPDGDWYQQGRYFGRRYGPGKDCASDLPYLRPAFQGPSSQDNTHHRTCCPDETVGEGARAPRSS